MSTQQSFPADKPPSDPKADDLATLWSSTTFPSDETHLYARALAVVRAHGDAVWCANDDHPYLDLVQGYGATPLGHCHPVVVESVIRNAALLDVTHSLVGAAQLRLAEEIRRTVPVPDARFHFTAGGAEAVGVALKTAFWLSGRHRVARLADGFHGHNLDCIPLSSEFVDARLYGPPAIHAETFAPGDASAIARLREGEFAALVIEPVQAAAGWRTLPVPWVHEIGAVCRETGTLLIADEIQSGLGRCGALFYSETLGIEPDILLLGKGLAGGAYPVGAVIARDSVVRAMPQERTGIGSTFSCILLQVARVVPVVRCKAHVPDRSEPRGPGAAG